MSDRTFENGSAIKKTSEDINIYQTTGNAFSITSGRLSYFLGLQGPSTTVDSACSSSLNSIHLACKSLQRGESQLAIAGGVNIILNPTLTISFCQGHLLAKDGHCKTFDAKADGYVRSEGCGIIILKRLSEAINDHDQIFGVIKATAVNQDGPSSGLTVPSMAAQAALIGEALKYAHLEPNDIDYIEAHGTGTPLGDPIEVDALSAVFGGKRDHPLWLGSVKTNIGHLEAAAGVAGVIKTVLALNHEAIPPHLHFKELNPHISLDSIPAKLPLSLTPWPRSNRARIAGVSSFGFSGTNAHAIIEEPPLIEHKKNEIDRLWHLLTLSAKTEGALNQLIDLYKIELPDEELADIAFTANTGRAHFTHRITVIAKTKEELLNKLQTGDYSIGQAARQLPKVAFIFKKSSENRELMETSPIFKEAMERNKGLEYALAELWKSWGIIPDYVVEEGQKDIPENTLVISIQDNWKDLLQTISQLYLNGIPIDWKGFDKPYNRKKILLPTYPFQRESCWVEALKVKSKAFPGMSSWFYQIIWQPKSLEKTEGEIKGLWLIVSEGKEEIYNLQAKSVKPEQAITAIGERAPEGVLWFVSGKDSLKHALKFVQTVSKLNIKLHLFFITRGIQTLGPIIDLDNAPFNGFYKTLKLEIPSFECRHIDLGLNDKLPLQELIALDQEGQVAYYEGIRYVPRLLPAQDIKPEKQFLVDPTTSYLITGGLGGLGLKTAEWLVEQGAKHLVLAGRKASKKIEIPNATIETVAVDISQKPEVDALMQKFGKEWPELKGIIHAAGVIDDGVLPSQDWDKFQRVFAPKVQGSWNLHESSLEKPLDFFILFSSVTSSLGSQGQINYASANAYMDALAYFRRIQGPTGFID